MEKNQEEILLKRMGTLLLAGAKMLAKTCKLCHSPLFQVKGEIICPYCSKTEKKEIEVKPEPKVPVEIKTEVKSKSKEIGYSVQKVIEVCLKDLTIKLSKEKETKNMYDIMKAIDLCLEILLKLGDLTRKS
jgi:UPF0148 protein